MVALSDINVDELHGMKRKQLQALCKKTGVKANGKSEELIERLMEHIQRGGSDSTSDDSNDDQQHYESAAEEDKSSPPPNEGAQNATPGKLFKVVPLLNTEPVVMDAPEAMSVVEPSQFSAQVKEFTAKLEARAAARFADQGVENIEKINPAFGLVTKTPKSQKLAKTILFDKAHDKLFSSGDSILSHWSAKKTAGPATPNGKRNNDSSVHESNKRPRVEVLFASPSVQPQSARQSRKSTRTRSMTAKAQRTAAPGAVLDGSKTAAVDNRVQTASDLKALSSTKLFADAPVADTSSVASEVAEFAPLAEMETTSVLAAASPAKAPLNPPTLQPDAATVSKPIVTTAAPLVAVAESAATESAATESAVTKPVTPEPVVAKSATTEPAVVSAEVISAVLDCTAPVPEVTSVSSKDTTKLPKPTHSDATKPAQSKPVTEKKDVVPAAKPSQIPAARKIAQPKLSTTTASKIQAPKTAGTKAIPAPTAVAAAAKPLNSQTAGYRNVESKIKAYINAKPPPPKTKPAKPSLPDSKSTAKSAPVTAKAARPVQVPAAKVTSKDVSDSKDVPNYMKSTRAKEIRSQQTMTKAQAKPELIKPKFHPYNRPAKPAVVKPSTAK